MGNLMSPGDDDVLVRAAPRATGRAQGLQRPGERHRKLRDKKDVIAGSAFAVEF